MPFDLDKFQRDFSRNLRNAKASSPMAAEGLHLATEGDAARLGVYKNNFRLTLSEHLAAIFPVSAKFVGSDFLGMAIRDFIQDHPPKTEVLHEYGAAFPEFLKAYEPLAELPYVSDICQVEWHIHALQFAADATEGAGRRVNPAMQTVESDYPLLRLWMVGAGQLAPEAVHVGSGSEHVAIVLVKGRVLLQPISNAELGMLNSLTEDFSAQVDSADPVFASCLEKAFIV